MTWEKSTQFVFASNCSKYYNPPQRLFQVLLHPERNTFEVAATMTFT